MVPIYGPGNLYREKNLKIFQNLFFRKIISNLDKEENYQGVPTEKSCMASIHNVR